MLWRLGAVVALCVALVACTPGEYKGRVITGLDYDGVLVAVLGVCDDDVLVTMNIYSVGETSVHYAEARHEHGTVGMRAELRADEAPPGWASDQWSLPDHDTVEVSVDTSGGATGQTLQHLDAAEVDLAAVPPLPDDATEQATEDC